MAIPFDPRETIAATNEELTRFQHEVASKVLGTVVLSTPVGMPGTWLSVPAKNYRPGHARGSWQTTLNREARADNALFDRGGAATIGRGIRIIRRSKLGVNIVIASLAPYMERLDQGWSRQAGANFIENAARRGADSVTNDTRTMPRSRRVRPRRRR